MSKSTPITVNILDDDLKNVLITAVEGGYTRSWAAFKSYDPDAGTVMVCEHNEERDKSKWGPWTKVTVEIIALGLQVAAAADLDEGGWAFGAWMRDRIGDASICDNILQFAVLDEVKYG